MPKIVEFGAIAWVMTDFEIPNVVTVYCTFAVPVPRALVYLYEWRGRWLLFFSSWNDQAGTIEWDAKRSPETSGRLRERRHGYHGYQQRCKKCVELRRWQLWQITHRWFLRFRLGKAAREIWCTYIRFYVASIERWAMCRRSCKMLISLASFFSTFSLSRSLLLYPTTTLHLAIVH